jgi:Ribonucleases P/MRP protein subunit POP1, N-terminal
MDSSMKSARQVHRFLDVLEIYLMSRRANATQRVWQTLPRHLRRRAASHDFRRVPVRLRMKAKLEVTPQIFLTWSLVLTIFHTVRRGEKKSSQEQKSEAREAEAYWSHRISSPSSKYFFS